MFWRSGLTHKSSTSESLLSSLGLIEAHRAGDTGAVELYRNSFSRGYLETGIIAFNAAILSRGFTDPRIFNQWPAELNTKHHSKYLGVIARAVRGRLSGYGFSRRVMEYQRLTALLDITDFILDNRIDGEDEAFFLSFLKTSALSKMDS